MEEFKMGMWAEALRPRNSVDFSRGEGITTLFRLTVDR